MSCYSNILWKSEALTECTATLHVLSYHSTMGCHYQEPSLFNLVMSFWSQNPLDLLMKKSYWIQWAFCLERGGVKSPPSCSSGISLKRGLSIQNADFLLGGTGPWIFSGELLEPLGKINQTLKKLISDELPIFGFALLVCESTASSKCFHVKAILSFNKVFIDFR